MPEIKSDTQRMREVRDLEQRGRRGRASRMLQDMGNEERNPKDKEFLWNEARRLRHGGK